MRVREARKLCAREAHYFVQALEEKPGKAVVYTAVFIRVESAENRGFC